MPHASIHILDSYSISVVLQHNATIAVSDILLAIFALFLQHILNKSTFANGHIEKIIGDHYLPSLILPIAHG